MGDHQIIKNRNPRKKFVIAMSIWPIKHLGDKTPEMPCALLLFYVCCKMRDLPHPDEGPS